MLIPIKDSNGNIIFTAGGNVGGNCACCGSSPTNPCGSTPPLSITISWTDGDTTKTVFGLSWTNGQQREVCPSYNCQVIGNGAENFYYQPSNPAPSPFSTLPERLNASAFGAPPTSVGSQQNIIKILGVATGTVGGTDLFQLSYTYGTQSGAIFNSYFYKYNIASMGFAKSDFTAPYPPGRPLQDFQFSFITTTKGLTVAWGRYIASAWNTCGL